MTQLGVKGVGRNFALAFFRHLGEAFIQIHQIVHLEMAEFIILMIVDEPNQVAGILGEVNLMIPVTATFFQPVDCAP